MSNAIKGILLVVVLATTSASLAMLGSANPLPATESGPCETMENEVVESEQTLHTRSLPMIPKESASQLVATCTDDTSYRGRTRPLREDVVIWVSSEIDPELLPMGIRVPGERS